MLSRQNRELLQFEEDHPSNTGKKKDLILFAFAMSAPQYYARLRYLATQQDAVEAFPMVCKRLQRQMRTRALQREALLDLTAS
jgi:hypothetical protein